MRYGPLTPMGAAHNLSEQVREFLNHGSADLDDALADYDEALGYETPEDVPSGPAVATLPLTRPDRRWVVVTLAARSRNVSSVFGDPAMTRAEAEALLDGLREHHKDHVDLGGIYPLAPSLDLRRRFEYDGMCIYDPASRRQGAAAL